MGLSIDTYKPTRIRAQVGSRLSTPALHSQEAFSKPLQYTEDLTPGLYGYSLIIFWISFFITVSCYLSISLTGL